MSTLLAKKAQEATLEELSRQFGMGRRQLVSLDASRSVDS